MSTAHFDKLKNCWALIHNLDYLIEGIYHQINNLGYFFFRRTTLKLESLEDAVVLDDPEEDLLQDKRGCPAYVSPEILRAHHTYSGRAADMWSLGVILYTMLVGRYVHIIACVNLGYLYYP